MTVIIPNVRGGGHVPLSQLLYRSMKQIDALKLDQLVALYPVKNLPLLQRNSHDLIYQKLFEVFE